jgi:CHAT domain-containing protein/predicted negative regulator of RcsB-dependent stress response
MRFPFCFNGYISYPLLGCLFFVATATARSQTPVPSQPLAVDIGVKRSRAEALFDQAYALFEQRTAESYRTALPIYVESSRLFDEIGDKSEKAGLALLGAATISSDLGDKGSALKTYNKALLFFQANGFKSWTARILTEMGRLYADLSNNQKALEFYTQAVSLIRELGDKQQLANTINYVGLLYNSVSDNKTALEYFSQALHISQEIGDKNLEADTLGNIGSALEDTGESEKALRHYDRSLALYRETGNQSGEATTLNNRGLSRVRLGEKQEALNDYEQARRLFKILGNPQGEADTLNNIGALYNDLGDLAKAFEYYLLALPLYRQLGDKNGEATALNNIGTIYTDQRDMKNGLNYHVESLKIYNEIGDKHGQVTAINNIAAIFDAIGDKKQALDYFNRSLPMIREIHDTRIEGLTLNNIGKIYADLGKKKQALEMYSQALPRLREAGDKGAEAGTLSNLMTDWAGYGNTRMAVFFGKQSVNRYQELRSNIAGLDKTLQRSYSKLVEPIYRKLADILIEQGQFAQADAVLSMLKDEEYFDFVRRDAGEIAKLGERVPLNEKEKLLIAEYSRLADKLTQLGQEFIVLDNRKRLLSRNDLTLASDEQKLYDEIEKQLDAANAGFQLFLTKYLFDQIGVDKIRDIEVDRSLQAKLRQWGEGTVALYTVAGADRYRVILTTPKVQVDGKTEIKAADLNRKIFEFRSALQNPSIDPRPLGKELYDILIKPIERDLAAAGAKTLVWSLDGSLRYLPLAALSPDGKKYLVEKVQNVIITSKTRDDLSAANTVWEGLGLGVSEAQTVVDPADVTKRIAFNALPGTERELKAIVRDELSMVENGIIPGRRFMNKEFSRANLRTALEKEGPDGTRKYNVVHIASHFRLGSSWSNSFLLLGNGETLTLEDLRNSSAIDLGAVDLVTLSACNTGFAGDTNGQEIDSLASVIQTKGVKAVLATLWSVADESTTMLMSEFYRLRKDDPALTKAEAIQLAQKAMINGKIEASGTGSVCRSDTVDLGNGSATPFKCDVNAPFSHPYFWSPFILIGNWK